MNYDRDQLSAMINGRPVYIWGAMIVGQGVCRAFERYNLPVQGFLDSSPSMQGTQALGYPVIAPEPMLAAARAGQAYIVIGSGHHDRAIAETCQVHGLVQEKDYLPSRELNDLDPSVDVSGACNLRCVSCPQGNIEDRPPVGFISLVDYQRVLDKLLREIPFLGSIQLYAWGEPLLNRQLPDIIACTRDARVLTAISTNLKIDRGLRQVVMAKPDWIKVSASGFGPEYAVGHTGGHWPQFLANLRKLARLRDAHHPGMQVILNYHLYKHSIGDSYRAMRELSQELGFIFRPNMAYLYSLDNVLDYIEGRPLSREAQQTLDLMLMDIDEGLARARQRRELPCPEERCLPINWDRRVRFCGVYFKPFIAEDFLETPLTEILARRTGSEFCGHCMSHGLHHYTGVYLEERILDNGEPEGWRQRQSGVANG